jgi:site-specific recombinase XerD
VFSHQLSGVEANRRDLNLFSRFCHETDCQDINGDAILTFIAWLKYDRENSAGSINRKISSIRSYIKYLRFRQVDGADDLPIEYLSRARQPYTGPYQTLSAEEVKQLLARPLPSILKILIWQSRLLRFTAKAGVNGCCR